MGGFAKDHGYDAVGKRRSPHVLTLGSEQIRVEEIVPQALCGILSKTVRRFGSDRC